MSKLVISGGNRLEGRVRVNGAKNAALAVMAASLLCEGETVLENVPSIDDVQVLAEILRSLGGRVRWEDGETLRICFPEPPGYLATYHQVKRLRASNLLLGPILARRGRAEVSLPGGCRIGSRPMDLHLKGLARMGSSTQIENGFIKARATRLQGNSIYLDFPSVGATENIMMAAALADGQTVLENAAKEPEIVDLASFLNAMGAKVRGAGTNLIRIIGVKSLRGVRYGIIPDRIEAGTYMVAAAITGGDVLVEGVIPTHLYPLIAKLQDADVWIGESDAGLRVIGPEKIRATDLKTLPYPGFPTDMQPQMMALLSLAEGTSIIVENVFENRLQAADEFKRMGARIKVEGQTAVIQGVSSLSGAVVKASDLRSGAALVLAGLAAAGRTEVQQAELIDRGYDRLEEKLNGLGGKISREE